MDAIIQDARFSLRLMRKRPGISVLVVTTLVFGIGLNAAIFSVVNAVVLRPLPLYEADRVVSLFARVNRSGATFGISYPEYLDWKAQARSFQELAVIYSVSFTMNGYGAPQHLKAAGISANGFRAWGVKTVLGREFREDEDHYGAARVVILNYRFWLRAFGGDPSVLGKVLVLDDQPYTVAGVLQASKVAPLAYPDVWVTNGPFLDKRMMRRESRYFFPIARLKPNVTPADAQAEMETIAGRLAAQYPDTNKGLGVTVVNENELFSSDGRKPLLLLVLASSLIFLLAAGNVMTVLVGNTFERGSELSVRLAVGASRVGLARQLFIQAFIFGFLGGTLGLLLAKLGLAFFLQRFPRALLRFQETTIDYRVMLLIMAMALLASFAAALLPALYALKLDPGRELRGEWSVFGQPKYRSAARGALIFFEVTLASGLALACGLLIKSFYEVEKVDLGFNPSHVFSFRVTLPANRYKESAQQTAFYRAALERLAGLPGMQLTGAISNLPLTNQADANPLEVGPESPMFGEHLPVQDESVLPGFFEAMRIPLLQGRDFSDSDDSGAPPVVILDDALAAKLWPNQNPLGKRVRITDSRNDPPIWREVVGIVQETKHFGPEHKVRWMQLYFPEYQNPTPALAFVVNTRLREKAVKGATDKAIHELDKDLPVESFSTLDAYLDTLLSARKISLFLLSGFAAIGILLGTIGIYGAVASSVIHRRRDMAIRMAVGATLFRVIVLVMRPSLLITLAGIAVGLGVVASMTRLLASSLFGIRPLDPIIYAACAIMIIASAVLASLLPAARLLRFNIQEILRQ